MTQPMIMIYPRWRLPEAAIADQASRLSTRQGWESVLQGLQQDKEPMSSSTRFSAALSASEPSKMQLCAQIAPNWPAVIAYANGLKRLDLSAHIADVACELISLSPADSLQMLCNLCSNRKVRFPNARRNCVPSITRR